MNEVNEIEILKKIFGEKKYKVIEKELDIKNYILTISFDDIRILKFKNESNDNNNIYIIYIYNLDIPYKLNNLDETYLTKIKNIYYNNKNNNNTKIKRFSGILKQINMTKDDLEKIIVKNKYLEKYYWGSYFDKYPFDDIYEKKYSRYQINNMNIYALRQYDDDDIFEINVLTRYSKSKITFKIYEEALLIELNYNDAIHNPELNKFYTSTQLIPCNIPIDLYLALQEFHLLDYYNIFELKPITVNHLKYSSLLLDNIDIVEIENYFKLLNDLNLETEELKTYRSDLINLITLNNIIKNINSQDILNIIEESIKECDNKECDNKECDNKECDYKECDNKECDNKECDNITINTTNNITNDITINTTNNTTNNITNDTTINKKSCKEKITEYLLNYLNEYKKTDNILSKELIKIEENNHDFLTLHMNNLIMKFIDN